MRRIALGSLGLVLAVACNVRSDLDDPCRMIVPDTSVDGGYRMLLASAFASDAGSDFLSTGDPDCEELVCIRRGNAAPGFYDDADGVAHGRCSVSCIPDRAGGESSNCSGASVPLQCARLGLDQATLDSFCASDPASCQSLLGSDPSATYCVDPQAVASTG